ncbi:hypothetical protein KW441_14070 [Vibrio fluvialis]|nr:hypothetical protein [Vibrio fluvialis]
MTKDYQDMRLVKVQRVAEAIGITSSAVHRMIAKRYPSAKQGSYVDIWHGSDRDGEDTPTEEGIGFCDYLIARGVDPWLPQLRIAKERRDPQAVLGVSQSQTKHNKLKNKRIIEGL